MTKTDNLIKIYAECSNGYHKVDDFRAKLLGFLPLASGIGIFGAMYIEPSKNILSNNFIALGFFGLFVTIGLLIYELKGIIKCTQFIFLGSWIESKMKETAKDDTEKNKDFDKMFTGYFTELSDGKAIMSNIVTEPVASAIIYSTVIAAWSYVIFLNSNYFKWIVPIIAFFLFVVSIYAYWRIVSKKIKNSFKNLSELAPEKV